MNILCCDWIFSLKKNFMYGNFHSLHIFYFAPDEGDFIVYETKHPRLNQKSSLGKWCLMISSTERQSLSQGDKSYSQKPWALETPPWHFSAVCPVMVLQPSSEAGEKALLSWVQQEKMALCCILLFYSYITHTPSHTLPPLTKQLVSRAEGRGNKHLLFYCFFCPN